MECPDKTPRQKERERDRQENSLQITEGAESSDLSDSLPQSPRGFRTKSNASRYIAPQRRRRCCGEKRGCVTEQGERERVSSRASRVGERSAGGKFSRREEKQVSRGPRGQPSVKPSAHVREIAGRPNSPSRRRCERDPGSCERSLCLPSGRANCEGSAWRPEKSNGGGFRWFARVAFKKRRDSKDGRSRSRARSLNGSCANVDAGIATLCLVRATVGIITAALVLRRVIGCSSACALGRSNTCFPLLKPHVERRIRANKDDNKSPFSRPSRSPSVNARTTAPPRRVRRGSSRRSAERCTFTQEPRAIDRRDRAFTTYTAVQDAIATESRRPAGLRHAAPAPRDPA